MFSASKTAAPVSGSFQVSNSLRFRASASAYLNRTPSVAGNRQTWTWSGWVKRGAIDTTNDGPYLFSAGPDGANFTHFGFASNASNGLKILTVIGGSTIVLNVITSAIFRDPSAWYHIVLAFDTTQATAANRVKIYVNGVQLTSFSTATYPSQNDSQSYVNAITPNYVGRSPETSYRYFDGYMAEINFIDGQALTPSSFGSINATTGVWQPARYTGSYGTNGFYLKFNNGISTTTLGNDSSGNGNNWTTNNISLTAGSTYDWMLDSPTSYAGSSYGVGNYAVFSPLGNGSGAASASGLSGGNLTLSGAITGGVQGTIGVPVGKWYWETTVAANLAPFVGICNDNRSLTADCGITLTNEYGLYMNPSLSYIDGSSNPWASGTISNGDIIGIAIDATDYANIKFWLSKNNVWFSSGGGTSGNPSAGTNAVQTITGSKTLYPFCAGRTAGASTLHVNFGQRPFQFSPPTGFKSLCTQNLPAPTIYNGANHMAATTYTGNGSTQSLSNAVNSVSFQPGLVWIKNRSGTNSHQLADSVRGVTKYLFSDATLAEETRTNQITAFSSTGFSLDSGAAVNTSANNFVGWQWKAGGTAVSNTSGTIASSVSANTTAGFSVVTYTGNGSLSATVGHGLGVAPAMIIQKGRNDSTWSWRVMHSGLATNQMLVLNATAAVYTNNVDGYIASVGSSTFGFSGGTPAVNTTSTTYVAYCFAAIAGYSAFGSYTGTIKMTWKIAKNGKPTDVAVSDSKYGGTPVGACVTQVVQGMRFPAYSGAAPPPVSIPLPLG